ncbi:MAG: ribosome biogenesis GTPase Der [Leptospirales bacterium]|nr:ribosome biogenesis GTPase Der [Leptospirales bacterium]
MGRRNVGKSTLLNALYGRRRAITDDTPGLTRDILEVEIERGPYHFVLCDTPGLDIEDPNELEATVLKRARDFIASVDLTLFLLEAPAPAAFDYDFLALLRSSGSKAPVAFAVNKIDGASHAAEGLAEFFEMGLLNATPISARGRWNLEALLESMAEQAPSLRRGNGAPLRSHAKGQRKDDSTVFPERNAEETRIAIVGRPNAGKSSLFNRLAGKDLSIVSEVPGTTRDTVDTILTYQGRQARIVDTAGLRRTAKLREEKARVDFFSTTRTRRAIHDARVVIHVLDATAGVTDFDKKISAMVNEMRRPAILAVNKWDALPNKNQKTMSEYRDRLEFLFPHARRFPVVFCSALSGQRIGDLLEAAFDLDQRMRLRIPTAELNNRVQNWFRGAPGTRAGLKILYATQPETEPPVFALFVNRRKDFRPNLSAYIENRLRKEYKLDGIPLRLYVRESGADRK